MSVSKLRPHARSFVWIKYETECFGLDSTPELGQLLLMRKEGNIYLNVKAVKNAHITGVESSPNFHGAINEQIGGPLSNIELTAIHLEITRKPSVNGVIIILHGCALFINNVSEELKNFHSDVLSKLNELQKVTQGNNEHISIMDIEKLASLILSINIMKEKIFYYKLTRCC